jgi:predicted small metal-binding protein
MTGEHLPVEFRCADVGVACRKVTRANSEEGLLAAVREHAHEAHGVELDETLVDYARSRVRTTGEPARG